MRYIYFILIIICTFSMDSKLFNSFSHYQHISIQNITVKSPASLLDQMNDKEWNILTFKNNYWEQQKLNLPYIEYSSEGLIANYNNLESKENKVDIFFKGEIIDSLEQKSLFPKIAFPFLIMSSQDLTYLEIYKLEDKKLKLLTQVNTQNIVTNFSASHNGEYLSITTLSNELIILDSKNQNKIYNINLGFNRSVTYASNIHNNGNFYALGNYSPSQVAFGNIKEPKTISYKNIPMDIYAQTQQLLDCGSSLFIHGIYDISVLQINKNSPNFLDIPKRPYSLLYTYNLQKNKIAMLYSLNLQEYLLDIVDLQKNKIIYQTHILTKSIPYFISEQNNNYLVYKQGALLL